MLILLWSSKARGGCWALASDRRAYFVGLSRVIIDRLLRAVLNNWECSKLGNNYRLNSSLDISVKF